MPSEQMIEMTLAAVVLAAPTTLVAILGGAPLLGRSLSETASARLVQLATFIGLLASCGMLAMMLLTDSRHVPVNVGNWVAIDHYHFSVKLLFDRLSIPFVILTFLLCGTIAAFASRYLHREPGFSRFFVLLSLFLLGMTLAAVAGTIETLFAGWELVGISSALLVAYFHERRAPVQNGLHIWTVYRISDAALLLAAIALHHLRGEGDFDLLLGTGSWPAGAAAVTSAQGLTIGLLLLVAVAGKSALIPFSGWLPRAMEGPTPSSAVFYGALSVHLGAYLLLRISPLLETSLLLCSAVIALGFLTALLGSVAGRVQSDFKSALAFASLTQVGLIVTEIGLGAALPDERVRVALRYIALVHILGHASLRTLQFLRASSLLADYRGLEDAIGEALPKAATTRPLEGWLYRLAMERGYLDLALLNWCVTPFLFVLRGCDSAERRFTQWLAGQPLGQPSAPAISSNAPSSDSQEDFL